FTVRVRYITKPPFSLNLEVGEALAREHGLRHDAREREHGQPAVLELLELHLRVVRAADLERVEAEVSRLAPRAVEHLQNREVADALGDGDPDADLRHRAHVHRHVVRVDRRHVVHFPREAEPQVRRDEADDREHADAAVLELALAEPLDGHPITQTERVEALVADHALELLRPRQERHRGRAPAFWEGLAARASCVLRVPPLSVAQRRRAGGPADRRPPFSDIVEDGGQSPLSARSASFGASVRCVGIVWTAPRLRGASARARFANRLLMLNRRCGRTLRC
ncbi:unnamed protein product, partial [Pelagomonas calceolata]